MAPPPTQPRYCAVACLGAGRACLGEGRLAPPRVAVLGLAPVPLERSDARDEGGPARGGQGLGARRARGCPRSAQLLPGCGRGGPAPGVGRGPSPARTRQLAQAQGRAAWVYAYDQARPRFQALARRRRCSCLRVTITVGPILDTGGARVLAADAGEISSGRTGRALRPIL